MQKPEVMKFRINEEQKRKIKEKSKEMGFFHTAEYIRFRVLIEDDIIQKIDKITQNISKK